MTTQATKTDGIDLDAELELSTVPAFLQYVEAHGHKEADPLSDEALRLQAQYIAEVGDHPLDVLKTLVRNPFVKPSDRITAAKTLLEYGARKVPAQLDVSAKNVAISIDPAQFAALSASELETLEKLLGKAQGAAV